MALRVSRRLTVLPTRLRRHPLGGTRTFCAEPGYALSAEGIDDAVLASRGQVVGGAGQRGRGPQEPSERIGQYLYVHAVVPLLAAVVGAVGGRSG